MLPAFIHRVFLLAAAAAVMLAFAAGAPDPEGPARHPVPESPLRGLSSLDRSDAMVRAAVLGLPGAHAIADFVHSSGLIRGFVAAVDDVAQGDLDRHRRAIEALGQLDPGDAVTLYSRLYPLLQQAYEEGYPRGGYFNDRFVQAIDRLLEDRGERGCAAAREVRKRLALRQPGR